MINIIWDVREGRKYSTSFQFSHKVIGSRVTDGLTQGLPIHDSRIALEQHTMDAPTVG